MRDFERFLHRAAREYGSSAYQFRFFFTYCIFSGSVDIAAFAVFGFSAKACIFYRLFQ